MNNFSKDIQNCADLTDEQSEVLWDMIKNVQNKEEGSLLKLANQLEENRWTDPITCE